MRGAGIAAFFALALVVAIPASRAQTGPIPDSPFGLMDPYTSFPLPRDATSLIGEVGASWVRFAAGKWGGLDWDSAEPVDGGGYQFSQDDSVVLEAANAGLRIVATIHPIARWDTTRCHSGAQQRDYYKLPCDLQAYKDFVAAAVNHYGDYVDHWQVYNEVDNSTFWTDSPENYAVLVKATADVVRALQPTDTVLLAGMGNPEFIDRVLSKLRTLDGSGRRSFDIVDMHVFGLAKGQSDPSIYRAVKRRSDTYRNLLGRYGHTGVPLWITETATYSGDPVDQEQVTPAQTEKEQARDTVKRLVYPQAFGVKKSFWVTLMEWYDYNNLGVNGPFDNAGLIRNPRHGDGAYRKLAHYTYAKLTSFLAGADFGSVTLVRDSTNVVVVRYTRGGLPVFVVWWDWFRESSATTKTIKVTVPYSTARVTKTVLPQSSGKDVSPTALQFSSSTVNASNGSIQIVLDKEPVLVERSF